MKKDLLFRVLKKLFLEKDAVEFISSVRGLLNQGEVKQAIELSLIKVGEVLLEVSKEYLPETGVELLKEALIQGLLSKYGLEVVVKKSLGTITVVGAVLDGVQEIADKMSIATLAVNYYLNDFGTRYSHITLKAEADFLEMGEMGTLKTGEIWPWRSPERQLSFILRPITEPYQSTNYICRDYNLEIFPLSGAKSNLNEVACLVDGNWVMSKDVLTPLSPANEIVTAGEFQDSLAGGGLGPVMVQLPGGTFTMGDIQGIGYDNEQPVHEVTVGAFAIGKYEVTFAEYDQFAEATGREKPNDQGWGRGTRPVITVSRQDAVAYTEWLSQQTGRDYRLPTEAEWEYAARGGTTTAYWWGDDVGHNNANCDGDDQWDYTAPVGSFNPNPFGLYDTAGNVWEWCQDVWHSNYQGAPTDGSAWVTGGHYHILRGGSWFNLSHFCRAASRIRTLDRLGDFGFRVGVSR